MSVCLLPYTGPLSSAGNSCNPVTWTGDPSATSPVDRRAITSHCVEISPRYHQPTTAGTTMAVTSPTKQVSYNEINSPTSLPQNQWSTVPRPGVVSVNPAPTGFAPAPYSSVGPTSHLGVYPQTRVRYFPVNSAPCPPTGQAPCRSAPNSLPLNSPVTPNCDIGHLSPYQHTSPTMSSTPATPVPVSPLCRPTPTMPVAGAFVPTVSPTPLSTRTHHVATKEKKPPRPYKLPVGAARKASAPTEGQGSPTSETSGGLSPLDSFRVRSWPLREWLYNHRNYPYPKKAEKRKLAQQVGWSHEQVSMWFANTRRRIKKVGMVIWSGGEFQDLNLKDVKVSSKGTCSSATPVSSPGFYQTAPPMPTMAMPLEHSMSVAEPGATRPITMHSIQQ